MFKATEVERKIRETNVLIDLQMNLSSCKTSDHYFSLSLQHLLRLGTKNMSSTYAPNVWKVKSYGSRKDAVEIMSRISS